MGDQKWLSSSRSLQLCRPRLRPACTGHRANNKWCIRWPQGARHEELKKRLINDRTLGKPAKGGGVCAPRPRSFLRAEETEDRVGARQQVTATWHDCLNKVPERSPPEMIRSCFYGGLRAEDAIKAATKISFSLDQDFEWYYTKWEQFQALPQKLNGYIKITRVYT